MQEGLEAVQNWKLKKQKSVHVKYGNVKMRGQSQKVVRPQYKH